MVIRRLGLVDLESNTDENRQDGLLRAYLLCHGELVRFLSRRLRCLFTAKDLAQELYLRARRVEAAGAVVDNPRALLFRIASNLATDHERSGFRRAQLLEEAHDILWNEPDGLSPERRTLADMDLQRIMTALERLPVRTREVFYLSRFEGLTNREIATKLGVSRTSVEKHIRCALERVATVRQRLELEEKGPTVRLSTKGAS